MTRPTLHLTVDLEFFDSTFLYRDLAPPPETTTLGLEGVRFLADLLERHDARATWFVLGEVADELPDLVADLSADDHEIASHGYSKSHPDLRTLPQSDVRSELRESKTALERVTDDEIRGFRAPAFTVDEDVLDAVDAAGYEYDSSVVPSLPIPGFYGFPDAPHVPHDRQTASGQRVSEHPVSVAPWLNLPISGAWMRLLGRRYALWGIEQCLERYGYAMLYVHPWELVDVPNYDQIPRRVSYRTGAHARETLRQAVERWSDRLELVRSPTDG